MFQKIWRLKGVLDNIGSDKPKLLVMGDLNTMGRKRTGSSAAISPEEEIIQLGKDAQKNGMQLLSKTDDNTWWKGPSKRRFESNLDHAIATRNISFEKFPRSSGSGFAQVRVEGWNKLKGKEKDDFSRNVSDHCAIFCEIKGT